MTFEQQDSSQPPGSLSSAAVPNPDLYKRQLEVVCNNATLAIFIMNEQQQCTYMNPAAEKLTGYCLAEVQGRALHYIIHHTHPDGTPYPLEDCPIDQAFPQNNQEQGEEVFVHKDGSFYPVAYTASPIREGEGVIGTIIEVRDITQEKLAAQTQQELDRAKINFFSNVSHEFRTPLTLMLSPLEDLLTSSQKLPPQQRETLKLVHRNGQRLLKLVNTLLDFSRLEAGRIQAVYEPTDLATLTAELASGFRAAIERAGLHLVVECPFLPELVYVDRDLWEKIVLNLLSNAFKFTFEGTITVCLQALDQQVALIVQDTGVGIPAEELPRLFERFHRVSGTASRSYEGSGIGLSLVQELVKLHGGTVEVSSELEQGTTFTVTLPLGQAHLPLDRIQASRTSESTALGAAPFVEEALRWVAKEGSQTVAAGQSEAAIPLALPPVAPSASTQPRILVADDNADMRQYIQGLLSQHYAVEAVADGESALKAIACQLPDLVLSDVMMPRLDGFGLLQALRADPRTQALPIILLSARAGEESRIAGLTAGADDYLIKPFSARELLARVEASLKLARLRQEAFQREQTLRLQVEMAQMTLETTLASVSDSLAVFDADWRYTYVNAKSIELTGMQEADLLGQTIWEVFPDLVGTQLEVEFRRAAAEQTPKQFEYFYPTWNRWFEMRVYPARDRVSVFTIEISDRKRAETAFQRSEERYRAFVQQSSEAIWCFEIEQPLSIGQSEDEQIQHFYQYAYLSECNQVMAQMYGAASPQDLIGMRLGELLIQSDSRNIEYLRAFIQSGYRLADAESFEPDQQGNPKVFLNNLVGILEDKRLIRVWGTQRDITDRKQAEAALHESEARYRILAEAIPQFVWVATAEGQNEFVNRQFCEYTGLTLEQMLNLDWLTIIHPDDVERTRNRWLSSVDRGSLYEIEYRFRRFDGTYRWFLGQGIPLRDEQDEVVKWFGTCTDIEQQKQIEQERVRLLQREQTAREAAEQANHIKDEFLAVLSHELRTPLNPILGWSRLLRSGKLDAAKTAQALETIERNAKLQTQLIEDLLDVSRILRGKMSLNMAPVNLISTLEAAMETVQLAAEAKAIQIQTRLDPEVGQVLGDSARLQQVIWNLLSNAVKFTPEGGRVEIRLQPVKSQAQIQISDTGKGIQLDFLPHVFEYFRQADSTTTRTFGGLGLGLAIVRHLVELHGGTVQAESAGEGQGATFTVRLPLIKNTDGKMLNQQWAAPAPAHLPLKDISILLVDDEADTREVTAFVLEQAGAIVTMAASGIEALPAFVQTPPDVLVSDIGMPDMDGYRLIQQIRSLPQGRQVFAIALTAYAGAINQQQALAAGFQRHLAKPIEPDELVKTISEGVEGSKSKAVEE